MSYAEYRIDKGFSSYEPKSRSGIVHPDHLGTPQKITDSSGTVVWAADYKPFGEATIITSTITNNLRFPGQYYDSETGLNYNYFRDYNLMIGRYVEVDTIGIRKGMNHLYVYVGNNPLVWTDPRGLMGTYHKPEVPNATAQLVGEIPAEILGMIVDETIGSITGAACASRYCKNHSTPSDWMKAYSTCTSNFAAHPDIPTGIPPYTTSDGYISACASSCMEITGKDNYKKLCLGCKK